jgi:hypothetical protein
MSATTVTPRTGRRLSAKWVTILLFLLPGLALYLLFVLFPVVQAVRYSLYNWNGLKPLTDFAGLDLIADRRLLHCTLTATEHPVRTVSAVRPTARIRATDAGAYLCSIRMRTQSRVRGGLLTMDMRHTIAVPCPGRRVCLSRRLGESRDPPA